MAAPAAEFTLFPNLPAEIRLEIWRLCLPHRVMEVDAPVHFCVFRESEKWEAPYPCCLGHASDANCLPPLISRVCREAREVAFKAGSIIEDLDARRPPEASWQSNTTRSRGWVDPARIIPHSSWWGIYEADFNWGGQPLNCVSWEASRLSGVGSLMVEHFRNWGRDWAWASSFDNLVENRDPPRTPLPPSPNTHNEISILKRIPTWLVVLRIIVVHAQPRDAAGTDLFGLLGDAPVQIVKLADADRVEALFQLAEACEGDLPRTVRQDFHEEFDAALTKKRLDDALWLQYGDKELMASMHPAIMFRLCTKFCNRIKHTEGCRCNSFGGRCRGGIRRNVARRGGNLSSGPSGRGP